MKIIKSTMAGIKGSYYYIQGSKPGELLSWKSNNYTKITADNIPDLMNFYIADVEFAFDRGTSSDRDEVVVEFDSFENFRRDYAEYFI